MERLTKKMKIGYALTNNCRFVDLEEIKLALKKLVLKLGEYEDTGLTPSEIMERLEKIPFVPKEGEEYFYIDKDSVYANVFYNFCPQDLFNLYFANVFRTSEEVTEVDIERMKKILDDIREGKRYGS